MELYVNIITKGDDEITTLQHYDNICTPDIGTVNIKSQKKPSFDESPQEEFWLQLQPEK